jgi:hypothetical protein
MLDEESGLLRGTRRGWIRQVDWCLTLSHIVLIALTGTTLGFVVATHTQTAKQAPTGAAGRTVAAAAPVLPTPAVPAAGCARYTLAECQYHSTECVHTPNDFKCTDKPTASTPSGSTCPTDPLGEPKIVSETCANTKRCTYSCAYFNQDPYMVQRYVYHPRCPPSHGFSSGKGKEVGRCTVTEG